MNNTQEYLLNHVVNWMRYLVPCKFNQNKYIHQTKYKDHPTKAQYILLFICFEELYYNLIFFEFKNGQQL